MACGWRHRLQQVLKIDLEKPSPAPMSGSAVHLACEDYLRTRVMKPEIAVEALKKMFADHAGVEGFEPEKLQGFIDSAINVLSEVPKWMEEQFPNWEFIDAEHALYEPIEGQPHAFKGYIDGVIRCDGKQGKKVIWLIDWKHVGRTWNAEKRSDPKVTNQLVYYKTFWSKKTNTDLKDIRCGFVLLFRGGKPGKLIELIPISVGDVTVGKALKVVGNMVSSVKKGIALKNRKECRYCVYKNTEHCT
jgi:hypothetical protein